MVPGTQAIETEFHTLLQRSVNFALANTPPELSHDMAMTILKTFYSGTAKDFDMLVSYCIEMITPNQAIPYTDVFVAMGVNYTEETGWLDTSRVGHNCGNFSEYGSILARAHQHPGQHHTCPGCILNNAVEHAFSIALKATQKFHDSVSELYRYNSTPRTFYSTTKRIGDMYICNEVNSVFPQEQSSW